MSTTNTVEATITSSMPTTVPGTRIKHVFDLVLAVEMPPAAVRAVGYDPIEEADGRTYFPVGEVRAGTVVDFGTPESEIEAKVTRTAAYHFKDANPEWSDSKLVGLGLEYARPPFVVR